MPRTGHPMNVTISNGLEIQENHRAADSSLVPVRIISIYLSILHS